MAVRRLSTPEDVEKLLPLVVQMREMADCIQSRIPFNDDAARRYVNYAITNPETFGGFIAVDENDEAFGFIGGWINPVWSNPDYKIIHDWGFFLTPEKRGSIAGARLLKAYEKWAKEVNADLVQIEVNADIDNEAAIKFLSGMGYSSEGLTMFKEI